MKRIDSIHTNGLKTKARSSDLKRFVTQFSLLAILLLLFSTCLPTTAAAASLTVSPKSVTLQVGQSKTVQAKASGVKKPVYVWKSSNTKVATVKNGKITAKAVGKATITVTVQKTKLKSNISVTVKPKKLNAQAAFKAVNPSVATIEMYDASDRLTSTGSGFVTKRGEVITNFHVVSGEANRYARIRFANGTEVETLKLKRFDDKLDLAILDVPSLQSIPTLPVAKAGSTGSVIYALGSPRGVSNTITEGILSNRDVYLDGLSYLQYTASTTFGNSGGPLVDEFGRVIGVVTGIRTDSQNMNYAVPIQQLDAMQYGRETIANVQEPSSGSDVIPAVSGEGETAEQELNDSFDDADVIRFASGHLSGAVQHQDDVDTYYFRTERRMTLSMVGGWSNNQNGVHWAYGLFDANGDSIRYSEEFMDEGRYYEALDLVIPPGEYFIVAFPISGLARSEYVRQPYAIYYELK